MQYIHSTIQVAKGAIFAVGLFVPTGHGME
jgi:hypothetical protein